MLTDRGQTMRFYKANTVRLDPDLIHQFLKEEGWREGEPWISPFAPGGQWSVDPRIAFQNVYSQPPQGIHNALLCTFITMGL